jgi:hypothetical protein
MYRPRELPANRQFTDDAGGAVDTSRGSSGKANAVAFAAVQPRRLELLKAASNALVADEQMLGDVGPNGVLRAFKTAPTRISVSRVGLW